MMFFDLLKPSGMQIELFWGGNLCRARYILAA